MLKSSRAALAIGLGLVGVAGFVAPLLGQEPVRQASTGTAPAAPKAATPAVIATLDMNKVINDYDRFRASRETINAEAQVREAELKKLDAEARQENEKLQKLAAGDPGQKKIADRITLLIAQFEAGKKQAQAEFSLKESEIMAAIYNDMQGMASRVAASRGYTMVVKYSPVPASGTDPDSIRAAMSNSVVYANPKIDITADVTRWLNQEYYQKGGQKPKGTADAAPPAAAQPR